MANVPPIHEIKGHKFPRLRTAGLEPITTKKCLECGGNIDAEAPCHLCYIRKLKERNKTNGDRHDATTISNSGNGRDMQANVGQRKIEATDR